MSAFLRSMCRLVVLTLVGCALPSAPNSAVRAADAIVLTPHWKQGEKIRYQLVNSRRRLQDGKKVRQNTSRNSLEVEVLQSHEDGFVVGWTLGEAKVDDPKAAENPLTQRMLDALKGFQIVIELDAEASILGIRNGKQLKATTDKMMTIILEELERAGYDKSQLKKLQSAVAPMFATQQQVEQHCLREPQVYFLAVGRSYELGKPIEYEDSLPNPWGGDPLPARGQFLLKSLDKKSGRATVVWKQAVDQRAAQAVIEKTLKHFAERMGKTGPPAGKLDSLTIEDAAEFAIETASGWVQSLSHTRTAKMGGSSEQNVLEITRHQ